MGDNTEVLDLLNQTNKLKIGKLKSTENENTETELVLESNIGQQIAQVLKRMEVYICMAKKEV